MCGVTINTEILLDCALAAWWLVEVTKSARLTPPSPLQSTYLLLHFLRCRALAGTVAALASLLNTFDHRPDARSCPSQ